jgi:MarR family transcriptional regulator, organic hydroperoxide resistance regulator
VRSSERHSRILRVDSAFSVELDAGLQFMRALWVAVHALQKTSKRMNLRLGITGPQRLVLRVVGLAPGISAGGLAKVLHLHPSTLTGVLKRLDAQGLVRRRADAADGRRAVLRLTPQGQRLNVATDGTVEAAVRATLRQVSPRDQAAVREALELLAEQLNAQPARTRVRRARPRSRPG